jgi:hypothetical protein
MEEAPCCHHHLPTIYGEHWFLINFILTLQPGILATLHQLNMSTVTHHDF